MKLKDADIRKTLLEELYSLHGSDEGTRIINELGIDFGSSRVDIAVVNGIIHGYEIKSESDNLNRLPMQMEYYNRLFERMTLVVDPKYYNDVMNIVPTWWGITVVKKRDNSLKLQQKRKGRLKTSQDKELLLKLLWKKELECLIDVTGLPKKLKKLRKNELLNLFLEKDVKLSTLRTFVYDSLKTREFWRD